MCVAQLRTLSLTVSLTLCLHCLVVLCGFITMRCYSQHPITTAEKQTITHHTAVELQFVEINLSAKSIFFQSAKSRTHSLPHNMETTIWHAFDSLGKRLVREKERDDCLPKQNTKCENTLLAYNL